MAGKQPLVIIGAGEFAEIACEYFTADSPYEVVAFSVERAFLDRDTLFDRPVVAFEDLEQRFPPAQYEAFVAITYTQLNRVRARLYQAAKSKGYRLATYVSSRAFRWPNATLGDNCFVFEANVIQYHVRVGSNVILWSGNHVGHRAVIGDHCFISSHVVISGYCDIGASCFLGVNACIADRVKLAPDCILGAGAVLTGTTEPAQVYRGNPAKPSGVSSLKLFKVKE